MILYVISIIVIILLILGLINDVKKLKIEIEIENLRHKIKWQRNKE